MIDKSRVRALINKIKCSISSPVGAQSCANCCFRTRVEGAFSKKSLIFCCNVKLLLKECQNVMEDVLDE